jgi:hypothetical protein
VWDRPGDEAGAIDADEMHEALTKAGAAITLEEVEEMINMVDDDGSGEIEFAEFCAIMETCVDGEPEYTYKVCNLLPLPTPGAAPDSARAICRPAPTRALATNRTTPAWMRRGGSVVTRRH